MPPCATNLKKKMLLTVEIPMDLLQNNEDVGKVGREQTDPLLTTREGDGH